MVTVGTLNFSALVSLAVFDWATVRSIVTVLLVGASDLGADLLLGNIVEVTDVLLVANVDTVSSSSAGVLSGSLGDLERPASAVALIVGVEGNARFSGEGVPRMAPCLLTVLLGKWELWLGNHEWSILSIWSAEDVLRKLFACFRNGNNLDVVIAAVLAPVDVHGGEMKGKGGDSFVVGENHPFHIFVVTVVVNDNLVTRSDEFVFGIERKSLSLGGSGCGSSDRGFSSGGCFGSGGLGGFSRSLLLATFPGKGGDD